MRILQRRGAASLLVVVALGGLLSGTEPSHRDDEDVSAKVDPGLTDIDPDGVHRQALAKLRFEPNRGQAEAEVSFVGQGTGRILLGASEITLPAELSRGGLAVSMHLKGANGEAEMEGVEQMAGTSNYLIGDDPSQWRTGIPTYAKVVARGVYPGIDVLYRDAPGGFEYDWLVAPGADPGVIAVTYPGTTGLTLDDGGDLLLSTPAGVVRQHRPVAYQEGPGLRRPVVAEYSVDSGVVRLEVGEWDRRHPLVIDPVISYSTYLGGPGGDRTQSVATGTDGSVYLAGDGRGFPIAPDTVYQQPGASDDAFIAKLAADGSLVYSTYFGGNNSDVLSDVSVDADGNAYLVGAADSADFPTTPDNRYHPTCGGLDSAYIAKLDRSGSRLLYSTCLPFAASANAVASRLGGIVYVAGRAGHAEFPTRHAFQPGYGGGFDDAFLMEIDTTGTGDAALVTSTFLGGQLGEVPRDLAVLGDDIFLVGNVNPDVSPVNDFPAGASRYSDACPDPLGESAAFLVRLHKSGTGPLELAYSACFGPAVVESLALDPESGHVYLAGGSIPDDGDLPATANAVFTVPRGGLDDFVAEFETTITGPESLRYLSYLGGSGDETPSPGKLGVTVTPDGHVWVAGDTVSMDFPSRNALTPAGPGGDRDAYLLELDTMRLGDASLVSSSIIGGSEADSARGIASGPDGGIWVGGLTRSTDFPLAGNSLQSTKSANAGDDAFLVEVNPSPQIDLLDPATGPVCGQTAVGVRGDNLGATTGVDFGGAPALSFKVVGDELVTAVSPAHSAGEIDVSVSVAGGLSNVLSFVYATPEPFVASLVPPRGPTSGGTPVTITGTGFSCATEVSFGGVAGADLEVGSDTELTVVAPPHPAGTVDVVVSNAATSSPPAQEARFVYDPPSPVVSTVAPDCGPTAGGTAVVITGTDLEGATTVSFGSVEVSAVAEPGSLGTRVRATSPARDPAEVVAITVTTPFGTSAPAAGAEFAYPCSAPVPPGEEPEDRNSPGGGTGTDQPVLAAPPGGGGGAPGGGFAVGPGATPAPGPGAGFTATPPGVPAPGAGPAPGGVSNPGFVANPGAGPAVGPSPGVAPVPGAGTALGSGPLPGVAPVPGSAPGFGVGAPEEAPEAGRGYFMVSGQAELGMALTVAVGATMLMSFGCALAWGTRSSGRGKAATAYR